MKMIRFTLVAVFGLLVANTYGDEPKSYRVNLSNAKIGTTQVIEGEYRLLVHRDEPKVQLVDLKTGKSVDVVAKVEDVDKKIDRTEVTSREVNGIKEISEIRIGGTKLRIDFQQTPSI